MGLHGLKSWDETLKTHDARAHKTISVARYPVRLSESNNTLQPCCCKPFLGSDENGCRRRGYRRLTASNQGPPDSITEPRRSDVFGVESRTIAPSVRAVRLRFLLTSS